MVDRESGTGADVSAQWAPGRRIGPYRIDEVIGSGGKAAVYRTRAPDGTVVAVKVLHPASLETEDAKRFVREFDILRRLDHPNIVRVYDSGTENGYPWIAMEYVADGRTLDDLIEGWRHAPTRDRWAQVELALRGMCEGLRYVHDAGLVHRDIKPSNVLVTRTGVPKLSDFGVVKDPKYRGTQLTVAGRLVGTVAFMAPEQITGEAVDARTDLYSLGAALYVMLTFKRPIEADSVAGYLARHLTEIPTPPTEVDASVPRRLERIAQRLLMKDPEHRFQSVDAVMEALDNTDDPDRAPLRGRDEELRRWSATLVGMLGGTGGCVAVVGRAGSGRTALAASMIDAARAHGAKVMTAQGDGEDPILSLLATLTDFPDSVPPSMRVRWLVQQVRERSWVIVVDDLDKASAKFRADIEQIAHELLVEHPAPTLVVFTVPSLDTLASLDGGGISLDVIELGRLRKRDVVTLLRDRGIGGAVATVLGRRLHAESDGWPRAVVQQLEALIEDGWFRRESAQLLPSKPIEAYARDPLPVPVPVKEETVRVLRSLDRDARELATFLAVIGRPAGAALLGRCVPRAIDVPRSLDRLLDLGFLVHDTEQGDALWFASRATARAIDEMLHDESRRRAHAAVARALGRSRRRGGSEELSHHLLEAGALSEAYPVLIQAAHDAGRTGRYGMVLHLCQQATEVRDAVEPKLAPVDALMLARRLASLEGEALLARGAWREAVAPLQRAVDTAREQADRATLGRCLATLGRAWYRQGRFDLAGPTLREALQVSSPGSSDRAAATRALADMALREGAFEKAAMLWEEALQAARRLGSRDGEARARRGLAHLRVFEKRLDEASALLDAAEDLLHPDGDSRVRSSVIARSIELDLAAGRYGSALFRCQTLLDLLRQNELGERMAEVFAYEAIVRLALGDHEAGREAVRQAVSYAGAAAEQAWRPRLIAARVLCDLGDFGGAQRALPDADALPTSSIDDPSAQHAAIRARIRGGARPSEARDLANWCMVRPAPLLVMAEVSIALDAARALAEAGDVPGGRSAAKQALKELTGPGLDGLRLEALLTLYRCAPDDRVLAAAGSVAARVAEALGPGTAGFLRRADVAAALDHHKN